MTLNEQIEKYVDFIGCDFSEEGKKQLRESYEFITKLAKKEESDKWRSFFAEASEQLLSEPNI